jgi:ATP-binding cassette, subfamily A (ABC1), member 3
MQLIRQTWVLTKKDLLIVGRHHWISTIIRSLTWPIVLSVILVNIKNWIFISGAHGVGTPSPIKSFEDALNEVGNARPRVVIINNGFDDGDTKFVIDQLTTTIQNSGKELHIAQNNTELQILCPSSSSGVTLCYGAVEFTASPDHGHGTWNYTLYFDGALGGIDISREDNDYQLYNLPFQYAIDDAISRSHGGPGLPKNVLQYPYTYQTQAEVDEENLKEWAGLCEGFLGFAFFIALCGIVYHMTGFIVRQRDQGMLQLIDAMMPNYRRWECVAARGYATVFAFNIVYLPGWIAVGGILNLAFPHTNVGLLILLCILCGLALSSFSLLASSLFKRAQLAAISSIVLALVLAIVAQFAESPFLVTANYAGVFATGLLFPPSAFVYVIIIASYFESNVQGLQLNVFPNFPRDSLLQQPWTAQASMFYAFFVFQIILYPALAILIEMYLWGTVSRARHLRHSDDMPGTAVRLSGFSKHFKSLVDKKQTVKAVDNLSMDVHAGSITVLLGHNGCGKSTTLNAIAGLETVTSGTIEVDGTGGLGICPQKNIMWNELTVEEHVSIFETLKTTSKRSRAEHRQEVTRLINGCDLEIKRAAKAKTLSGGQKRKLQLAMMFAGGSRVCCIDEASSGIDPLARRKIWDILLAERGLRTMLLTTHFLDEADVLSDHVSILSKGSLRAEGSSASLKQELGGGYRVTVDKNVRLPNLDNVKQSSDYNFTVFEFSNQSDLAAFLGLLEQHDIRNYRVHGSTIEDVFLKLIDEVKESKLAKEFEISEESGNQLLNLNVGKGRGPVQQIWFLFKKRLIILKHNYMPYVCALFVSLAVAGLVTLFLTDFEYPNGIPCFDPNKTQQNTYTEKLFPDLIEFGSFVGGPRSINNTIQKLVSLNPVPYYDGGPSVGSTIPFVNSLSAFHDYINANSSSTWFGGFYDDPNTPTFAWQESPMLLQSIVDTVLLNQSIVVSYQPFSTAFNPVNGATGLVAVITTLGFAIYPCLFALYPTAERIRNVRAMQYSNGIHSSSLWIAYSLFDLIFVVLISVFTVVIWAVKWTGWYGLGYMWVVFMLYGLASTAFSYVISLMVRSQAAAIAYTMTVQVIVSMLYFVG